MFFYESDDIDVKSTYYVVKKTKIDISIDNSSDFKIKFYKQTKYKTKKKNRKARKNKVNYKFKDK